MELQQHARLDRIVAFRPRDAVDDLGAVHSVAEAARYANADAPFESEKFTFALAHFPRLRDLHRHDAFHVRLPKGFSGIDARLRQCLGSQPRFLELETWGGPLGPRDALFQIEPLWVLERAGPGSDFQRSDCSSGLGQLADRHRPDGFEQLLLGSDHRIGCQCGCRKYACKQKESHVHVCPVLTRRSDAAPIRKEPRVRGMSHP